MRSCIRDNSIVVWQRPLPESRELMIQNFIWLSKKNCLLLVDLDDHPGLFDRKSQNQMLNQKFANLSCCHGILTSNGHLANELKKYNPSIYTIDNCIGNIPKTPDLPKHWHDSNDSKRIKIFIANQNREEEHKSIIEGLLKLLKQDQRIHLEIVADTKLSKKMPAARITSHPRLTYCEYRKILSQCHIALAPLSHSVENKCKTVIKWQECTAEGVVLVAGPELYGSTLSKNVGAWIDEINELVPTTIKLINNPELRENILKSAWRHLDHNGWVGDRQTLWHGWLMETLWKKRCRLDYYATGRIAQLMNKKEITRHGEALGQ